MIINLTLSVTLEMPDGTVSVDGSDGRAWLLPNGDWIKPWITLELNDLRDLTQEEIAALEIDIEEMIEAVEIIEEQGA